MLHSRTWVLTLLVVLFLAVCVVLRLLGPSETTPATPTTGAVEQPAAEAIVEFPPVETSPEITPPSTTTPEAPTLEPTPVQPVKETTGCYVGGCSGQICSDSSGAMSTCEWREEYACYNTARCERQSTGECGWSETPELKSCLNNAAIGTGEGLQVR